MTQPNVDFRSELAGHATALRSLATRLVSPADAEDLTQDAMVTALTQPRPRRVRPWLRQVLRNEARAQRRSTMRRQAREQRAELIDAAPALDVLTEHAQMADAVRDALGALDPTYRRVLEARFYDERTAADIARCEGCPAGTVRWRVQEGLRRMRSALDARFQDREAWRGRMAAFAAAPLVLPGPTPGETTMSLSPLFTKLSIGLLAGSAVVGTAAVVTTTSSDVAAEDPSPRPVVTAASTAQVPMPRPTVVEPEASSTRPTQHEDTPPTDPGCRTCAGEGMPSFDAIAECQESFVVSEDGRVDINIVLDGNVVDTVTVRSQQEADEGLVACLREALPGSEAVLHGDGVAPQELNLALFPDVAAVDASTGRVTPLEMAELGVLPVRSEGEAPVRTIVACADYDCAFCDKARATLDQVLDEYPDVRLAWMHTPLASHPDAFTAAKAAIAAQAQGKFWPMHALLFDRPGQRSDADMRALAAEAGLDVAAFERDFAAESTAASVETQRESCLAAGARGTPSFFVEDTVLVGAQPTEAFRNLLD